MLLCEEVFFVRNVYLMVKVWIENTIKSQIVMFTELLRQSVPDIF